MIEIKNKVIVVTGAAGNLGSAVVNRSLQGYGVVCALDHQKGRLKELFRNLKNGSVLHLYDEVDVTDRKGLISLAERIKNEVGQVEVVVNTVGGFNAGESVHEISAESWQRMMDLNVKSVLNTAAAFIPGMIENKRGKFITIGSGASLQGPAKTGAYAAAKGAVLRLTESMAAELKQDNIQANCILPGTINTPENRKAMPDANVEKWVTPEQVSDAILFLASAESDAINGASLPVYGGS